MVLADLRTQELSKVARRHIDSVSRNLDALGNVLELDENVIRLVECAYVYVLKSARHETRLEF